MFCDNGCVIVPGKRKAAMPEEQRGEMTEFYCPQCDRPADRPLRCGDCGSLICRQCGTPLEQADELGIG